MEKGRKKEKFMKKLIEILLVAVAAVSLFVACAPEAKYYTTTFSKNRYEKGRI